MNPEDAPRLLAMAAARDNRKPSQPMALAWFQDLGDLDFDIAVGAMNVHYRTSTEYLMPVHIRRIADELLRERRTAEREALERQQRRAELDSRPITDRSEELQQLLKSTAEKLATSESARQKALLVARAMKGRPELPKARRRGETPKRGRVEWPPPANADVAALARQYLADGHRPDDLADRLGISRKWLRRAANDRGSLPPPTPVGPLRTPGKDTDRET